MDVDLARRVAGECTFIGKRVGVEPVIGRRRVTSGQAERHRQQRGA